ncbi:acyl carrier protein [Streptomyces sp. NPDC050704]|uniref:acyl carrier protein n=1 Tax=Streptomyces sp. NPDC050704 TaxID=3157219 RepID=UPI0034442F03
MTSFGEATTDEDIRKRVRAFLHEALREEIDDETDIFATGRANSLLAMNLVVFVEKEFDLTVEAEDLDPAHFSSVSALTAFVGRKRGAPARTRP